MNSHEVWLSHNTLNWMTTIATGGLSVIWLVYDLVRLRRFVPQGGEAHDEIFGSIIGLVIATLGIIGVSYFHFGS